MTVSRWDLHRPLAVTTASGWRMEVLVAPAPFFGVNGVRIGPDGTCWVAQHRAGVISSWDAESDRIALRSPVGAPIVSPDDLAFGADGTAYVSELGDSAARAMRSDGSYLTIHDDCPRANGITVDRAGRLFVSEFRAGGRIVELFPGAPGEARVVVPELNWANAFEGGPDGRLYYQDVPAGTVSSVDPDDGDIRLELEGLQMPSAVKFDAAGRIVVSESAAGTVTAFGAAGRRDEVLAALPAGIDNFCFDPGGRLYVSRNSSGQLVRIAAGRTGPDRETAGGLTGPQALGQAADGTLLVTDILAVQALGDAGLEGVWQLRLPEHHFTAVDTAGVDDAVVIVAGSGDVFRVPSGGGAPARVLAATSPGTAYHERAPGAAVAVERFGAGAIVGCADGRLVELGADGAVIAERRSGLRGITALAADGGRLAVCDGAAGVCVVLGEADSPSQISGLGPVDDVALGPDGLYLARGNHRTIGLRPRDGGPEVELAAGLPFGLPGGRSGHDRRASLLRRADGAIVVGCDGDGSIRQLVEI